jgi:hypothetical protein
MTTINATHTEDGSTQIGPSLHNLEEYEGFFVEKTEAPAEVVPEQKAEEKLLAGKFKTPEELEKAYAELQKKLGAPKEEAPKADEVKPEEKPDETTEEKPAEATEEKPAETAEAPVLDFAKLSEEWQTNEGKLSDETQANLTKLGITPEVTGLFYAGIEAIIGQRSATVQSLAGSAEEYKSLVEWGVANLPAAEQAAFNNALDKALYEGDTAAISLMVPAVKAKMAGGAPSYVQSQTGVGQAAIQPFANRSEQSAAINDPRYGRDRAYTREIERRIEISSV